MMERCLWAILPVGVCSSRMSTNMNIGCRHDGVLLLVVSADLQGRSQQDGSKVLHELGSLAFGRTSPPEIQRRSKHCSRCRQALPDVPAVTAGKMHQCDSPHGRIEGQDAGMQQVQPLRLVAYHFAAAGVSGRKEALAGQFCAHLEHEQPVYLCIELGRP